MNVTFSCPHCEHASRAELPPESAAPVERPAIKCDHCGHEFPIPRGALSAERLNRCLICPSTDLFVRKDFPQRLGVTVVTLGLLATCVTYYGYHLYWTYGIFFATALIDVVLYLVVPNALMCYRCGAQYRGAPGLDSHAPFNLETHERHRQQKARLAEHQGMKMTNVESTTMES